MPGLSIPTFTDTETGVTVSNTYATIQRFGGNTDTTTFTVAFYTANPSTNNIRAFYNKNYDIPTSIVVGANATDVIVNVFTYLQSLPDFTGSTFVS